MAAVTSALSNGQDQVISNANVLNATGNITYLECNSLAIAEALIKMFPSVRPSDMATESAPTPKTPIFTAQDPLVTDASSVPTTVESEDGAPGQAAGTSTESETSINTFPNYGTASLPSEAISRAPASCDVYIEHMFPLKHGYPLWFPEPDSSCSLEYRRKGVSIGDVGVITSDGGFDFLFNIWLKAQDPINPNNLPADFDSAPRPERRTIPRTVFVPGPNNKVSNLNILSSFDTRDISFICKDSRKGGILLMPHGASKEDLRNEIHLKEFISKNAVSWYRYARITCGIDLDRHSLYVVTGNTKSKTWGIATFDVTAPERDSLLVMGKANDVNSPYYEWRETGEASHNRTGPMPDSDLNYEDGIQASPQNQCLFLRGFKISLSKDTWDEMLNPGKVVIMDGNKLYNNNGLFDSSGSTKNTTCSSGNSENRSGQTISSNNIGVMNFPVKHTLFHPLNVINEIILSQVPEANIAITHDNFWIEILGQHNFHHYTVKQLQDIIKSKHVITIDYDGETKTCTLDLIELNHIDRLWTSTLPSLNAFKENSFVDEAIGKRAGNPWVI
ncbi:hypothetical protein BDQ17DRAFT_1364706 [Cyathus striatus]|nr:hypothetical protein BDQ17DRAFT_1364706 [Cyathus striatus]